MGLRLGPEECSGECKIGSLHVSGHWTGNWKILSQLQQYAKKVIEIKVFSNSNKQREQCDPEKCNKVVSEKMSGCYPMLEKFTIENIESTYSAPLLSFICQHSSLHILSLKQCSLSSIATSSLMYFLQSPNNRLHRLTLDDCEFQIPDHSISDSISYRLKLTSPKDSGNFSLEITGSLYAINYILSQPHQFYANTLAILKVVIVSETTNSLQIETSFYPNLNVLNITSEEKNHTLLHDSIFHIISQPRPNTLCILISLKRCNITCDTVRSLIHSLQTSHCGLQELTLDDCIFNHTHTTTASSKLKLKSLDSGNVSLEFTGYCCDISHWLSQLSSYTQLTELILHLKRQDSTTTDTLQEILSYRHMLESLKIDIDQSCIYFIPYAIPLSTTIPWLIELQQNNLHNLSLGTCNLSSDVTRLLIHSLQSPCCRLHKLAMDKCTISTPNETQQKTISTKINATLCLLVTTDSLCVLNHILSNVIFTQMTELGLFTATCNSSAAEVLTKIPVSCPVLEIIKIGSFVSLSLPLSIAQFIGSQQNNLHTLSLRRCSLSSDVTRSLIHSLQSPHCKLHKLSIDLCTIIISTPNETQQNTISTKNNATLCSLVTTDSLCVLNHILSNVLFTKLTELNLCTTTHSSLAAEVLTKIPVSCPVLETVTIDSSVSLSLHLSISHFIGSQQNNLHTLSLRRCTLSSEVTRSLIHSLQSPHCKLYKLALYDCTIHTTDHTQLTTAIVSSTTITHLLFIDRNIDTPSLTALASGLKHNTTIEQLVVDKYGGYFTKYQFQVLIDAVDSSAVKKLWLFDCSHYKSWFSDHAFSRNHSNIEWCSGYYNLYNKW